MTTRIDAIAFSWAGDKYLGRSYDEMDCQAFVERCMADCGLQIDLGGSNSWYREIRENGWVGTPEECVKLFGSVPKGALLFIRSEVGPKTPGKFRTDGIGDITHIGIKTGRNEGAIHSSHSKGGVVTSPFKDKTVPNGGWNRVGLYNRIDYGKSVNWVVEHSGSGEKPTTETEEEQPVKMKTAADTGQNVNMRSKPNQWASLVDRVPIGQTVEVMGTDGEWSRVSWKGKKGYMMSQYLVADDSGIPAEDPDDFEPVDGDHDGGERVALYFAVEELAAALPILEKATSQILETVGRG